MLLLFIYQHDKNINNLLTKLTDSGINYIEKTKYVNNGGKEYANKVW